MFARCLGYILPLAGGEPGAVELVIDVGAARVVPGALIYTDHPAVLAGDAAIRKEVGRVGEDQVHGIGWKRRHDFQAIGLIDADVMFGVVEGRFGQSLGLDECD